MPTSYIKRVVESIPAASLVIPVHDQPERTLRCLESVWRHTRPRFEVIVVDNASRPPMRAALARLQRAGRLRHVRRSVNDSFAAAVNAGMRVSRGRALVWLNNDVVVGPGWLERLLACLDRARDAGAVGPCTDDPDSGSGRGALHRPSPDRFAAFAAAWGLRFDRQREEAGRLSGFCLALRREAVEAVGLLDERFEWGEEDEDYCLRLRLAGYRLYLARDVFVHHDGGATRGGWSRARQARLRRRNRELFRAKWVTLSRELRRDAEAVVRWLA